MEGKVTSVYYKDLSAEEKDYVDGVYRQKMLDDRKAFIRNPLYAGWGPEDVWYLRLDYINSWKHSDNYLFTKCECGSLDFDCLKDIMADNGLDRDCLYRCKKCGKVHQEYN